MVNDILTRTGDVVIKMLTMQTGGITSSKVEDGQIFVFEEDWSSTFPEDSDRIQS